MKRITTIIIIVIALGGAAYFGYQAFARAQAPAVATSQSQILPFGNALNFDAVKKYNKDGHLFQYPVVTPPEIGPDLGSIIK